MQASSPPLRRGMARESADFGCATNCEPNRTFVLLSSSSSSSSSSSPPEYSCVFDVSSLKGARPTNQDRWSVYKSKDDRVVVYGLYDGHGGSSASDLLYQKLALKIVEDVETLLEKPEQTISKAFKEINEEVVKQNPSQMRRNATNGRMTGNPGAGSTAIVAILAPPRIFFANVGDSKATILVGSKVIFETPSQCPDRRDERLRIEELGGKILKTRDGSMRVEGILAITRAFGNAGIKKFVEPVPEIFEFPISKCETFVLMTDGITDVLDSSTVSEVVSKAIESEKQNKSERAQNISPVSLNFRNERTSSQVLTSLSMKRKTTDNASAIVVRCSDNLSSFEYDDTMMVKTVPTSPVVLTALENEELLSVGDARISIQATLAKTPPTLQSSRKRRSLPNTPLVSAQEEKKTPRLQTEKDT